MTLRKIITYALLYFIPLAQAQEPHTDFPPVISVINNDVAPYIYSDNGTFKGPYYERLEALFAEAKLDFQLQLMPWPRVYKTLLQQPNTLVVSIGRTPKREALFNWVGLISEDVTNMYYYKLKDSDHDFNKLTAKGPYIVGVLRDTYYEEFVEQQAFDQRYYYAVLNGTDLVQMLLKRRVDFVIFSQDHIKQETTTLGVHESQFEKAGFAFKVGHYMAFSKNTSEPLLRRIRQAHAAINKNKTLK